MQVLGRAGTESWNDGHDRGDESGGKSESRNEAAGAGISRPTDRLGTYRARDGSEAAPVGIDLDSPHAALVVGKRGSGKSYTLGVLAEAAARTHGVAPVVVDPMGVFSGLAEQGPTADIAATVVRNPTVAADTLPPSSWPGLVGLDATGPAGALVWQAASESSSLVAMQTHVADANATDDVRRAARNHLELADSWGVFDPDGLVAADLLGGEATVLNLQESRTHPRTRSVQRSLEGCTTVVCRVGRPHPRMPKPRRTPMVREIRHGFRGCSSTKHTCSSTASLRVRYGRF